MIKAICIKDLKLFFSDKKSVLITFLLPILLISLFAFAFGGIGTSSAKPKVIKLLVTDLDNTKESIKIIKSLDSIKGIQIILTTLDKATNAIRKGKYVGVLIFKNGFQEAIIKEKSAPLELKYDVSREIEIGMLQTVLMEVLMKNLGQNTAVKSLKNYLNKELAGLTKIKRNEILNKININNNNNNTTTSNLVNLKLSTIVKEKNNNTSFGLIQAVAGTAIMMLLFSIAEIGGGLLEEKEAGTLKRLLYSPIEPKDILFGKMAAALILAVLQLLIMFVFAWLAFGLPIFKDVISLLVLIFSVAFAVASFGIFLVAIAKSRKQLSGLSSIIILTMSAIGGSMIPIFIMPEIMQKIAVFSVNYWGIQGFYDIFSRGLSFTEITPRIFVLIGIGLFMSFISIRLFKKNLFKMI